MSYIIILYIYVVTFFLTYFNLKLINTDSIHLLIIIMDGISVVSSENTGSKKTIFYRIVVLIIQNCYMNTELLYYYFRNDYFRWELLYISRIVILIQNCCIIISVTTIFDGNFYKQLKTINKNFY